jgi:hypothetical protein
MEEKELVRRVKNSIRAGMSDATIIKSMQSSGYRLEYINLLMRKARRGRKILIILSVILVFVFLLLIAVGAVFYAMFFANTGVKADMPNPLDGMNINFEKRAEVEGSVENGGEVGLVEVGDDSLSEEVYVEDIKITPEFISYLLNELGAWQLKANPLSGEKPIINFVIEGESFSSIVDSGIVTVEGMNEEADIDFYSTKEEIIKAMLSDYPANVFRDSYADSKSSLEVKKSETELFSKGYLKLYDSLKS